MSKKKTTEEFQKELDQIFGDNSFEVLSEYITNQIKIKLKCNKCGNIIYKQPVKMVSGKEGCYICSIKLVRLPYFLKKDFCSILANELQVNTEITA